MLRLREWQKDNYSRSNQKADLKKGAMEEKRIRTLWK